MYFELNTDGICWTYFSVKLGFPTKFVTWYLADSKICRNLIFVQGLGEIFHKKQEQERPGIRLNMASELKNKI